MQRFTDLLDEPDFDVYSDGIWVGDLTLHQKAQLQISTLAEEES